MKSLVVDASVAAKWFLREEFSREAIALLRKNCTFAAPDLITTEVANVMWKHVRRKHLAREDAAQILDEFLRFPIDIHACGPLILNAWELATELDRTVYDSVYLALAIQMDCPFVTADRRLANAMKRGQLAGHIRWIGE